MSLEFEDKTGELPTQRDFDEAIRAIDVAMVRHITTIPPELGVSLGVISRCLRAGRAVFARIEQQSKEGNDRE